MVVIRLSRGGTKKRPFYSVVAANSRAARDGRYLERLGYFNPIATGGEKRLELNRERIKHWMDIGAQPSERVVHLLCELDNPGLVEKRKLKNTSRKLRAKEKAQAATTEAAEAAA